MIYITGVDLVKFAQKVYDLSSVQGMGFLQAVDGPLSDEDAKRFVIDGDVSIALTMDYVYGRACKMTVLRDDEGRLLINDTWFDHSHNALVTLLEEFGITI